MFDTPVKVPKLVQVDRNKYGKHKWTYREVYVFFVRSKKGQRKYIVYLSFYKENYYIIDFHATQSGPDRYRKTTNQFATGKVGSNLLSVMDLLFKLSPDAHIGMQCACLPYETSDTETRRFSTYLSVLLRVLSKTRKILTDNLRSRIFVIPLHSVHTSQSITKRYEEFFDDSQDES